MNKNEFTFDLQRFTASMPDNKGQVVNLITSTDTATSLKAGIVKPGTGLRASEDGTLSVIIDDIRVEDAQSAASLATARSLTVSLSNTTTTTKFDGSKDVDNIKVSGILPVANGGTGKNDLNNVTVGTAGSLQSARSLTVSLSNTTTATKFDGSKDVDNIKVSGILPVANGGTGVSSLDDITVGKAKNISVSGSSNITVINAQSNVASSLTSGIATDGSFFFDITGPDTSHLRKFMIYQKTPSATVKTITLIDSSGNSNFPGTITAAAFTGSLNGGAASLATARSLAVSLSNTTTATTFNGSKDVTNIKVTGILPVANGGTGVNSLASITAGKADVLATARSLAVSLSNTTTATTFNGSKDVTNIKVSGILPVANGGTGVSNLDNITVGKATKLKDAVNINKLAFDGSSEITFCGTCSTAAATATKDVTISGNLDANVHYAVVAVTFRYVNTAENPYLSVNGVSLPIARHNTILTTGNDIKFTFKTYQTVWFRSQNVGSTLCWHIIEQSQAEYDANRDKIDTTYAKLTGATFTGPVIFKGDINNVLLSFDATSFSTVASSDEEDVDSYTGVSAFSGFYMAYKHTYGSSLILQAASSLALASGEAGAKLIRLKNTDASIPGYDETSENLYIASDKNIEFWTNLNNRSITKPNLGSRFIMNTNAQFVTPKLQIGGPDRQSDFGSVWLNGTSRIYFGNNHAYLGASRLASVNVTVEGAETDEEDTSVSDIEVTDTVLDTWGGIGPDVILNSGQQLILSSGEAAGTMYKPDSNDSIPVTDWDGTVTDGRIKGLNTEYLYLLSDRNIVFINNIQEGTASTSKYRGIINTKGIYFRGFYGLNASIASATVTSATVSTALTVPTIKISNELQFHTKSDSDAIFTGIRRLTGNDNGYGLLLQASRNLVISAGEAGAHALNAAGTADSLPGFVSSYYSTEGLALLSDEAIALFTNCNDITGGFPNSNKFTFGNDGNVIFPKKLTVYGHLNINDGQIFSQNFGNLKMVSKAGTLGTGYNMIGSHLASSVEGISKREGAYFPGINFYSETHRYSGLIAVDPAGNQVWLNGGNNLVLGAGTGALFKIRVDALAQSLDTSNENVHILGDDGIYFYTNYNEGNKQENVIVAGSFVKDTLTVPNILLTDSDKGGGISYTDSGNTFTGIQSVYKSTTGHSLLIQGRALILAAGAAGQSAISLAATASSISGFSSAHVSTTNLSILSNNSIFLFSNVDTPENVHKLTWRNTGILSVEGGGVFDSSLKTSTLTADTIKGGTFNGNLLLNAGASTDYGLSWFVNCETAGDVVAKTATTNNGNYTLRQGNIVMMKLNYPNTASNPTLNIDGSGAKALYYGSNELTANVSLKRLTGTDMMAGWYLLVYFGSSYIVLVSPVTHIVNGGTGQTSLANVTVGTASTADTAGKADVLTTARSLAVSLSNTTTATTFNGSKDVTNIKVSGILPVANGGTGVSNLDNITVGKAKADASGNTITSTYLKLSGGTTTGTITLGTNASPTFITMPTGSRIGMNCNTDSSFSGLGMMTYHSDSSNGADVLLQGGQKLILSAGDHGIAVYNGTSSATSASINSTGSGEGIYLMSDYGIHLRTNCNALPTDTAVKFYEFDSGTLTTPTLSAEAITGTAVYAINTDNKYLDYDTTAQRNKLIRVYDLSWWNGKYNSTKSNLQYCKLGEFDTAATVAATTFASLAGANTFTAANTFTSLHANTLTVRSISVVNSEGTPYNLRIDLSNDVSAPITINTHWTPPIKGTLGINHGGTGATAIASAQNNLGVNGHFYCEIATDAATVKKENDSTKFPMTNFTLRQGTTVTFYLVNANTASKPTLSFNGITAHAIYNGKTQLTTSAMKAGLYTVVYHTDAKVSGPPANVWSIIRMPD